MVAGPARERAMRTAQALFEQPGGERRTFTREKLMYVDGRDAVPRRNPRRGDPCSAQRSKDVGLDGRQASGGDASLAGDFGAIAGRAQNLRQEIAQMQAKQMPQLGRGRERA